MKTKILLLAILGVVVGFSAASTTAVAEAGVGACVAGTGFSLGLAQLGDEPYVGVNVGTNSEPGVYDDQAEYETQCCAENDQEPDCFEPVQ